MKVITAWSVSRSCITPSSLKRITALGCCCWRSCARSILSASTRRLTLIPPAVEPAQAQTIDPNRSVMMANEVHVLESAVAKPVVEATVTNWKQAWRNEVPNVG